MESCSCGQKSKKKTYKRLAGYSVHSRFICECEFLNLLKNSAKTIQLTDIALSLLASLGAGRTLAMDLCKVAGTLPELFSHHATQLQETIAHLKEINLAQDVKPFQVLLVGAEGSGKNALLEMLLGCKFPAARTCNERLGIEIVLTPATSTRIEATIRLDNSLLPVKRLDQTQVSRQNLVEIVRDASKSVGKLNPNDFSLAMLRIEVSLPNILAFTITRLPRACGSV